MPTPFQALLMDASAKVDALHGERVRIDPRAPGKYTAGGVDPGRSAITVTGVFDEKPLFAKAKDQGQYDGHTPDAQVTRPHCVFRDTEFASKDEWPRQNDRIVLLDRSGEPIYQVQYVEYDGLHHVLVAVTPV